MFLCMCFAHLHHFYQYFLFLRKDLALLNLISKYATSASEYCMKNKDAVGLCVK